MDRQCESFSRIFNSATGLDKSFIFIRNTRTPLAINENSKKKKNQNFEKKSKISVFIKFQNFKKKKIKYQLKNKKTSKCS